MLDNSALIMTKDEISRLIHITDPFLLIDEVVACEPEKFIRTAYKATEDKWYFKCHISHLGVMPATLIIEGMLQSMVLLIYKSHCHGSNASYVTNIESKIIKPVRAGAHISYYASINYAKRGLFKGRITGMVEGHEIGWVDVVYASPHMYYCKNGVKSERSKV